MLVLQSPVRLSIVRTGLAYYNYYNYNKLFFFSFFFVIALQFLISISRVTHARTLYVHSMIIG